MRRRLPKIAVTLVVGALINVIVAWSGAAMTNVGRGTVSELYTDLGGGNHWEVFRWDTFAGSRIFSSCWQGATPAPHNPGDPATRLSGWAGIEPPDRETPQFKTVVREAWGVPARSMTCGFVSDQTSPGKTERRKDHVLQVRSPRRNGTAGIYLPLAPTWLGFAINTVVYALVALVASAVPRDVVRPVPRLRLAAAPAT